MNRRRLAVLGSSVALSVSLSGSVLAEPTANQKATAEALFQRGVELAEGGRLADACKQFDSSLQIDPALGTLFRLADCYDRIGRTASAWALFSEAQARAKGAEQVQRERMAEERAASLASRLSKLALDLGGNATLAGVELRLNDVRVPSASWGVELPVDPGVQRVRLSAPGRRPWSGTVSVAEGPSTRHFSLPELEELAPAVASEPKPPAPAPRPAPAPAAPSTYPAWLGYAAGGVGLVGLGVAGVMGYRAYDLNQQSLDQCSQLDANACTSRGDALRDDARTSGVTSTAFTIAGGALLAAGVTLVLLRPSEPESRATSLTLSTRLSSHGAFAGVRGAF
jgi:tetratricopeptide (TPR) repeat protein